MESGSAGKRTVDASQVGDLLLQAEVSLLKRSADDLSQYHQVPRSTSRSGSRGRSGRSRGREEGWEYSRLSKLRLRDREQRGRIGIGEGKGERKGSGEMKGNLSNVTFCTIRSQLYNRNKKNGSVAGRRGRKRK